MMLQGGKTIKLIFSKRGTILVFCFSIFLLLTGTLNIFAAPPTTKYNPGDTLDPNCAPGSTNCGVLAGGGMEIGGAITSATEGSVLFAGTGGVLTQDNTNFFWDDANNRLGIGTNTPRVTLELGGDGAILAIGAHGSGWAEPDLGAGTRMLWYPARSAFRAGRVSGTQWNDANIGDYSASFGRNNEASGTFSFAVGDGNIASDAYTIAFGLESTASGEGSFAGGFQSIASDSYSFAMGDSSMASGYISFAFGNSVDATNDMSVAFGNSTTASGVSSVALGDNTTASGNYSFSVGKDTTAAGRYSSAFGYTTNADSFMSTVLGRYNVGGGTGTSWVSTDSIFEIGIGAGIGSEANALTVLKDGNVGIGDTSPAALFTVGSGDLFQVTLTGAISAVVGITGINGDIKFANGANRTIQTIDAVGGSGNDAKNLTILTGNGDGTGNAGLINITGGNGGSSAGIGGSINIQAGQGGTNGFGGSINIISGDGNGGTDGYINFNVAGTDFARFISGGNFGIGDLTPAALFTVGSGDLFQVNSYGAIAAATGITSSGIYSLTAGTSTDSFIDLTSTGDFLIKDNNNTFVTFRDTGRVGIGTGATAPNEALLIKDADSAQTKLLIENTSTTGTPDITLYNANGGSNTNYIKYFINGSSGGYNEMSLGATGQAGFTTGAAVTKFVINTYNGDIIFGTNSSAAGVERMRISTGGLVSIGGDTTPDYKLDVDTDIASNYAAGFFNDGNDDNRWGIVIQAGADTPVANKWIQFNDGDGTDQGSICYTGGQANICAPSDVRLKENIVDTNLSLQSLLNIKVRDFSYLSDSEHRTIHGFVAQELYEIYPSAVVVPENPDEYWKVSYAQLTPLIVKSIQDLNIKLEPLTSLNTSNPNSLASLIKRFLADAGNGLEKLFVKEIYTQKICVGNTCIDETELNNLINKNSQTIIIQQQPTDQNQNSEENTEQQNLTNGNENSENIEENNSQNETQTQNTSEQSVDNSEVLSDENQI